jgi:carbamoyltransferase
MNILGIGGVLSNPAAALVKDGVLAAAVEEKKLSRNEDRGTLPEHAIAACLKLGGLTHAGVECVAVARPFSIGRETAFHLELRAKFPKARLLVVEHHTAHAASAYFASPFEEATVLTLDRLGDFRCAAKWAGRGNELDLQEELYYPDSIGDLYGRVAQLLGYRANQDEHKVQWLSAAGDDRFQEVFGEILGTGNWPALDRSYFDRDRLDRGGFSTKLYDRLELGDGDEVPERLKAHVAAGLQKAVEAMVARMASGSGNLCLAGGLAQNVLLVASLERQYNVFVQPVGGNAGTALGAALHAWHSTYDGKQRVSLGDLCLGPSFNAQDIKQVLENCKLRFRYLLTGGELLEAAVRELQDHKIIAWMQGRMEFGPRALGNRSILASPLDPFSSENLNTFIKHREPFRKFAASVPESLAGEYFEVGPNARYLATVGRVKDAHRKTFEGAVLGDGMVRVHTVRAADNPLLHELLLAFGRQTGLPVLYNTSFNLFNDPIVCSPRDAVRSFYSSGIDSMFVGPFLLEK